MKRQPIRPLVIAWRGQCPDRAYWWTVAEPRYPVPGYITGRVFRAATPEQIDAILDSDQVPDREREHLEHYKGAPEYHHCQAVADLILDHTAAPWAEGSWGLAIQDPRTGWRLAPTP